MRSTTYSLIRDAILHKKIVLAKYHGFERHLCPHVLGESRSGKEQALFYQFGGRSSRGLGPVGSPINWRCFTLSELQDIRVEVGEWHTVSNHSRPQSCVYSVDVEVMI